MADFYEEDIETAIKSATSLIEPILMVVLGSIIAVLVLAMYLPVFEMGSVAGG
jgi:type IV pilus assembly protein PilC